MVVPNQHLCFSIRRKLKIACLFINFFESQTPGYNECISAHCSFIKWRPLKGQTKWNNDIIWTVNESYCVEDNMLSKTRGQMLPKTRNMSNIHYKMIFLHGRKQATYKRAKEKER